MSAVLRITDVDVSAAHAIAVLCLGKRIGRTHAFVIATLLFLRQVDIAAQRVCV